MYIHKIYVLIDIKHKVDHQEIKYILQQQKKLNTNFFFVYFNIFDLKLKTSIIGSVNQMPLPLRRTWTSNISGAIFFCQMIK